MTYLSSGFEAMTPLYSEVDSSESFVDLPAMGVVYGDIGQTGDNHRHRITVLQQQIRETKYQHMAVSGLLRNCAKLCPIYEFYKTTTEKGRETREKAFISL